MTKRITVAQIAEMAGIAQSTASEILNGKWQERRISATQADVVLELARKHNYRLNRLVQGLRNGRTHTVVLILPTVRGEYFPQIAAAVEREAKNHGYHLLISQIASAEDEEGEIEALLERRVDGLILTPRGSHQQYYSRLIAQGIPLVFVDSYVPSVPCPAVACDNLADMYTATEHLIKLGHRRIGYIGNVRKDEFHLNARLAGFRQATEAHGLQVPDRWIFDSPVDTFRADLTRMIKQADRPTALAAETDYAALVALSVAEGLGLRVPEDLAVVGFSDCLANMAFMRVPLTSMRTDLVKMGQLAMRQFVREVEHLSNKHKLIPVESQLVVRASTVAEPP